MTGIIVLRHHSERTTFDFFTLENIYRQHLYTTTFVCLIHGRLHSAVLSNILNLTLGTKTWTLIPPEYAGFLVNPVIGSLPKSIESTDSQYPYLHKARAAAITVQQFPGETIFVPSGWYHEVVNIGFVIRCTRLMLVQLSH